MNLETLFSNHSKKYDTKKKTNRAAKLVKDNAFFELLKTDGLTSEYIKAFKHPIFKYQSQITLHGIFDNSDVVKVGGYANVIINKNGSVGIKYNAIDYSKKRFLANYLNLYNWHYCRDSKGDQFSQSFTNKTACLEVWAKINIDSFYCSKFVFYNPLSGLFTICINVNALLETEIWPLFTAITGENKNDAEIKLQAAKLADIARQEKWDAERKADQAIRDERKVVATELINREYLPQISHLKAFNGTFTKDVVLVRCAIASDYTGVFVYYKLSKAGAYYTSRKVTSSELISTPDFNSYKATRLAERDFKLLLKRLGITPDNTKVA